jgi:hypothetical protein
MSEEIIEEVIELSQEELDVIEAERVEAERIEAERLAEEAKIEAERLLEVARIVDIKERYKNLKDHRAAGTALGISNVDLHVKKICENPDKVKAEADIAELESHDSIQHVARQSTEYIEKRRSEYRSIEEVIHIILDKGMDSQEFIDLQSERAAIKIKYPKQ